MSVSECKSKSEYECKSKSGTSWFNREGLIPKFGELMIPSWRMHCYYICQFTSCGGGEERRGEERREERKFNFNILSVRLRINE